LKQPDDGCNDKIERISMMENITQRAADILTAFGVDASNPLSVAGVALICPLLIAVLWGAVLPSIANTHEKKRDR
jgi:hypothetical protein